MAHRREYDDGCAREKDVAEADRDQVRLPLRLLRAPPTEADAGVGVIGESDRAEQLLRRCRCPVSESGAWCLLLCCAQSMVETPPARVLAALRRRSGEGCAHSCR